MRPRRAGHRHTAAAATTRARALGARRLGAHLAFAGAFWLAAGASVGTASAQSSGASGAGSAAQATEEAWSFELWNELMSPYCPGRTLSDCPSTQADELRGWIREQEELGRSKQEVEALLYARFGDQILQAPRAEGFGLAAYVIPAVVFLAGGALVTLFLRRQGRRAGEPETPPEAGAPHEPESPELERLLDEELERSGP